MPEAVIVAALRTAMGKRQGTLRHKRPDELAADVLQGLVARAGIDPALVEDVILGCVTQTGEQGANIARLASLMAGLPVEVPAVTLNRMCGSSQQAVHFAAQAIQAGAQEVVIAGGVENMSRVPLGSDWSSLSPRLTEQYEIISQGISADRIAAKWGFSRGELDRLSLESHRRAADAADSGRFDREILPVEVGTSEGERIRFGRDEGIRRDTSLEKMAGLRPAFQADGLITAGNSSQISDGAAALLLMEREKAEALGFRPRARVVATAVVGSDPTLMLTGPIPATGKVLEKAGLRLDDIDVIEVNEAFASVVLAWAHEWEADMSRVNPNGGAIALGHPVGASGARIMTTLLHELERTGGRFGLQTMCIGHGMATATVIERI